MNSIDFAWYMAEEAHKNQTYGKDKYPYIRHIFDVQLSVSKLNMPKSLINKCRLIAVWHDVFEDTKFLKLSDMISFYNQDVVDALDAITQREGELYNDYLIRVSKNKVASIVKFCDLFENYRNGKRNKHNQGILFLRTQLSSKFFEDLFKEHIKEAFGE